VSYREIAPRTLGELGPVCHNIAASYVNVLRRDGSPSLLTEGTPVKLKLTSIYVDDQEKALRFYTDVLGFVPKADFSNDGYRWLTVGAPDNEDGIELQLALNSNPAAQTYQAAMFEQGQPAIMFYSDDLNADYERIKAAGGMFTMEPTDVTASSIATLNDTCGNLVQITQLKGW